LEQCISDAGFGRRVKTWGSVFGGVFALETFVNQK
jgi:hypothetical protein